jgi:hypothetical protein
MCHLGKGSIQEVMYMVTARDVVKIHPKIRKQLS